jgi:SAM-dependent methyltransferase
MPRLYDDLAEWWPLISAPADYAEEADVYRKVLDRATVGALDGVLELGSGGGNNASHLKRHFAMTLVDLSPGMIEVSRDLNPDCEHVVGDMRTIRLNRQFDAVFVHDAIEYITARVDLESVVQTAYVHCRPGGAVLFVPDTLRDSFQPATSHGGHDGAGRAARYLEWVHDPDPDDTTYLADYVFVLRDADSIPVVVFDRHELGLFSEANWLDILGAAGFEARFDTAELSGGEVVQLFTGRRSV